MLVMPLILQKNGVRTSLLLGYQSANILYSEIKQDTFKVMWDLSASGGDVEGCFLRATEDEFFYTDTDVSSNWMPDVSSRFSLFG